METFRKFWKEIITVLFGITVGSVLTLNSYGGTPGKFGIVYSTTTGRIRSIIPPAPTQDLDNIKVGEGEEMLRLDDTSYVEDLDQLQDIVSQQIGLVPTNDRYAVVDDTGQVVGIIIADPSAGDYLPGFSLIPSKTAQVGWSWQSGKGFIAPPPLPDDPQPSNRDSYK